MPSRDGRRAALVAYCMVDRVRRGRYRALALAARQAGATHLELGFPFSDPIADGPVLQARADAAVRHGTDWRDLEAAIRDVASILPTYVMSYANPLWRRGLDRALGEIGRAGARGFLVPDLSLEESPPWSRASRRSGLELVLLAAPSSDRRRVVALARQSAGFLYLVSRYGTTGAGRTAGAAALAPIVRAAHAARPELPVYLGFGIRDAASARSALRTGADGVVVATALEERFGELPRPATVGRILTPIARALRHAAT